MTFEERLNELIDEVEVPDELSPENIALMLKAKTTQSKMETTAAQTPMPTETTMAAPIMPTAITTAKTMKPPTSRVMLTAMASSKTLLPMQATS